MIPNIIGKFTTNLKNALKSAGIIAKQAKRDKIEPVDLLTALIRQKGGIAGEILLKTGLKIPADVYIPETKEPLDSITPISAVLPELSPAGKKALEKAALISSRYKHKYVGTEHLLHGLLETKDGGLEKMFIQQSINTNELKQHLKTVLKSTSKFPELTKVFDQNHSPAGAPEPRDAGQNSALEFFCTDLTDQYVQKNIDPVIGREEEITRLIHVLARRTKNNPVLIGEPGTGKTAIVEGLAKRIMEGNVPEILKKCKILSLDLTLVVAGTIYRGEFEARIKQIIDEVKNNPNAILFIDEVHMIIGAGSTSGSMDAANILKPALSKGEIRCIGATTLDEYRKHIESDAALERRFQPILIEEPTAEETLTVLKGIKKNYEDYHRVEITDEALKAAIKLSVRYLQDKFLPDKAIDLIDESASRLKINQKADPLIYEQTVLEKELLKTKNIKEEAIINENFTEATELKERQKTMEIKLVALREKIKQSNKVPLGKITAQDVATVISRITKIPLAELSIGEKEKIVNLEKIINQQIIGQEEAVKAVCGFIKRSRAGLTSPRRPLGSFIFLGPTGVGKTETAKAIARTVFDSESSLIRIDMSEFSESFQASKLIGAPAGYVGYKDGGKLTESVRRKPYSVVLFDEIEKAHPDIFNLLLQILEDGNITDAAGKKINFKNTIIILTSNLGLSRLNESAIGFSSDKKESQSNYETIKQQVTKELENKFRPEFLNRIDKTIVFKPLDLASIKKIVGLQLDELKNRLTEKGIKLDLSEAALDELARKSFIPEKGAREVRRVVQEFVETPLADKILKEDLSGGKTVKMGARKKELVIEN